jgi:TRAP-type C4-dicarboxylate transport system permease small subunit
MTVDREQDDVPVERGRFVLERALAAMAMAALCAITFANVVARYLTAYSFAFTEEYSIFLMVVMTLLGTSAAIVTDRHIRITILVEKLAPGPRRRIAGVVCWGVAAVMFALLTWYGGRLAYDNWRFEETSPGLGVPVWMYTIWLPILSAVITGRALMRTAACARGAAP